MATLVNEEEGKDKLTMHAVRYLDKYVKIDGRWWIANWAEYSTAHPVCTQYVYLSLGDREEFTRNRAVAQVGNNVRAEYARLTEQLGTGRCTLEWNPGNHFANGPIRTAKGFAWCLSKLKNNPVSNEI